MSRELLRELNQRPIAYMPIYTKITGSITATVLLSQLMYWFAKTDKFYKTNDEIMSETYLSENELRGAKKLIKKLDFITVALEGIPAKTYYEIDWEMYETCLVEATQPVPLNPLNCTSGINDTVQVNTTKLYRKTMLHTETTTETTTYSNVATGVATHLLNKILTYKPNFKKPTTLKSWIEDIEKAMRLDKRTESELLECIDWIYASRDNFWAGNIMSGKKLREKFDIIESQMMKSTKQKGLMEIASEQGTTVTEQFNQMILEQQGATA